MKMYSHILNMYMYMSICIAGTVLFSEIKFVFDGNFQHPKYVHSIVLLQMRLC